MVDVCILAVKKQIAAWCYGGDGLTHALYMRNTCDASRCLLEDARKRAFALEYRRNKICHVYNSCVLNVSLKTRSDVLSNCCS